MNDDHITEIHEDYLFRRIREGTVDQCRAACNEIMRRLNAARKGYEMNLESLMIWVIILSLIVLLAVVRAFAAKK